MTKSELVANLTTLNPLIPSNLIEEGANEILEKIVSALAMGKRIEIEDLVVFPFVIEKNVSLVILKMGRVLHLKPKQWHISKQEKNLKSVWI